MLCLSTEFKVARSAAKKKEGLVHVLWHGAKAFPWPLTVALALIETCTVAYCP